MTSSHFLLGFSFSQQVNFIYSMWLLNLTVEMGYKYKIKALKGNI